MLNCHKAVTLYNAYEDEDGREHLTRTVIRGVSWFHSSAASFNVRGELLADTFSIRIPEHADTGGKSYIEPGAWPAADKDAHWTLQEGDLVVKGECQYSGDVQNEILSLPDEQITVKSWGDNRGGGLSHWRVSSRHADKF